MSYVRYWDAPGGLWRFFVRRKPDGTPTLAGDPLTFRQHDWSFDASGVFGQETADSVLSPDGFAGFEYESFPPWQPPYTSNGGNGGDITIVTSDGWAKAASTMDGGHPGLLYYFVGPGFGDPATGQVGGWVLCGPDVKIGAWSSVICYLRESDSTPRTPVGAYSPSYTRYLIDTIEVPFKSNNQPAASRSLECIVCEHYNGTDPANALQLERFWYANGWGKIRWEYWANGTQTDTLRAPPIAYGFPTSPSLTASHSLLDVRMWSNIVDQPGPVWVPPIKGFLSGPELSVSDFGWPPNFVLP